MPSAWLISRPRPSVMKQEKSWLWVKIGLRAVLQHHLAHSLGDVIDPLLNEGERHGIKISAHIASR